MIKLLSKFENHHAKSSRIGVLDKKKNCQLVMDLHAQYRAIRIGL